MSTDNTSPVVETADAQFRHWEQLRLIYNGVLLLAFTPWIMTFVANTKFTEFAIEGAIGANLLYCVGPVVEGYAVLIGLPRRPVRYLLFAGGLLLAVALEVLAILFFLNPDQF